MDTGTFCSEEKIQIRSFRPIVYENGTSPQCRTCTSSIYSAVICSMLNWKALGECKPPPVTTIPSNQRTVCHAKKLNDSLDKNFCRLLYFKIIIISDTDRQQLPELTPNIILPIAILLYVMVLSYFHVADYCDLSFEY